MPRQNRRFASKISKFFPLIVLFLLYSLPQPEFTDQPPFIKDDIISFDEIENVQQRKASFIRYMRPIIKMENDRVIQQRVRLIDLYAKYQKEQPLTQFEWAWLRDLAKDYRISVDGPFGHKIWLLLLKRVDIVPVNMALAQAASESGWGQSRFAQMGNSLFGQWTYFQKTGMIPEGRQDGKTHRVAKFDSVQDSVRSYIRNLNTHDAYEHFRSIRLTQRLMGMELDSYKLVEGIEKYSQRRQAYVKEIRQIIKQNEDFIRSREGLQ